MNEEITTSEQVIHDELTEAFCEKIMRDAEGCSDWEQLLIVGNLRNMARYFTAEQLANAFEDDLASEVRVDALVMDTNLQETPEWFEEWRIKMRDKYLVRKGYDPDELGERGVAFIREELNKHKSAN